jgi:hypothetical protein
MLGDDGFELPVGWEGAAFAAVTPFSTTPSRLHPAGSLVLSRVEQRKRTALGVWNARTGKLIRLLPNAADARWTPDGQHLVTADETITVTVLACPTLSLRHEAHVEFDVRSGVGGLELEVSNAGRLGALWIYSGQSEEGYVLSRYLTLPRWRRSHTSAARAHRRACSRRTIGIWRWWSSRAPSGGRAMRTAPTGRRPPRAAPCTGRRFTSRRRDCRACTPSSRSSLTCRGDGCRAMRYRERPGRETSDS